LYGAKSKTAVYRVFYTLTKPLLHFASAGLNRHAAIRSAVPPGVYKTIPTIDCNATAVDGASSNF
jgi:hypothetical protein